jgi:transposase-like protein
MSGTSKQYGGKEMLGGSAQSDRSELKAWLRSQTIPQALAMRARIVLGSARGESVRELAERLCVSQPTVYMWRRRLRELGIAGLRSRPSSGRRRRVSHAQEREVVAATMRPPEDRNPLKRPASGDWPSRCSSAPPPCTASGSITGCNRIGWSISSSASIRNSTANWHRGLAQLLPSRRRRLLTSRQRRSRSGARPCFSCSSSTLL